jgi:putative heme transporter
MDDARIEGTVMAERPSDSSTLDANAGEPRRAGPEFEMAVRPGGHAELVPEWLVNLAALGWRVIAVAALVVILWLVASVLWVVTASIAVAIVISACFAPMVLRLRAGGRSRTAAAGIVWLVAILVGVVVLLLLALAFLPAAAELLSRVDAGLTALQAKLAELQIPPFVGTLARDAISAARTITGDEGGGLVASAASLITVLILATFLVFFFLRDGDKAWVWIFQTVSDQKRERITTAGDDALARVGGYLRGTTVLSGLVAVTDLVFMLVLGVPLAAPLAVLAFLAGFIPYFGGIVTTAIILLVTWAALGPTTVVVLLALIGIRNLILGYAVRPAVYGRTVKLHPALVLIVLPAGYELAGILGLFAAVPVTAVVLAVAAASVALVDPDPHPPLPGLVPAWLDRIAQWSWRIIVVCALVAFVVVAFVVFPLVLTPLVLAVILAATLDPLVRWLMGRGHSRSRAAAIAVGGGFLAVTGVLVLTMVSLVDQAGAIADGTNSGASSVDAALGGLLGLGTDAVAGGALQAVQAIASVAENLATAGVIVLLGTLFTFYLLKDGGRLWGRLIARVPPTAVAEVSAAGSRAAEVLGGYMFGTAAVSFVGAASQLVIMVVLGIPLALPVFVLSFLLCFIPYIGGFISTGIAFLLTVAFGSPADIAIMAIWTIVFNLVTGNIVSPLVYGRTVHLHPAIVLVAIPAGSAVAGMLGMFLVVPAIGVVAATWRTVLAIMGNDSMPVAAAVPITLAVPVTPVVPVAESVPGQAPPASA